MSADRIQRIWLAGLLLAWMVEIPILAIIGAAWGISRVEGEVIAGISVAPFIIPVFVMLACFFGNEVLEALRGDGK